MRDRFVAKESSQQFCSLHDGHFNLSACVIFRSRIPRFRKNPHRLSCANSPARAGKIAKVTSFQDGNDLACGLQIINPEDAQGL
jgi:hypothetical protein